jgi:hypothetical protein
MKCYLVLNLALLGFASSDTYSIITGGEELKILVDFSVLRLFRVCIAVALGIFIVQDVFYVI